MIRIKNANIDIGIETELIEAEPNLNVSKDWSKLNALVVGQIANYRA